MVTAPRTEWVSVIAGSAGSIALLALITYTVFYCYSWMYGCDCGDESPFSEAASIRSDDPLWKEFVKCSIGMDRNLSGTITYTPGVTALDGKNVSISGFMQPLEASEKSGHFLLSKNAPTCAYCPPNRSNEVVEIFSSKPMAWKQNLLTMSGTLHLENDGKKGAFFQMKDAVEH